MTAPDIAGLLSPDSPLRAHVDYLRAIALPSVTITTDNHPPKGVESRFGGDPLVPTDFTWPEHDVGYYRFLGHINFADMADAPAAMPDSGILSLFFAEDEEGEVFWGDDGYIVGYYWPDAAALQPMKSPHDTPPKAKRLHFANAFDLPRHRELRDDWPFDPDLLDALSDALPDDYLLGYPSHTSLAYDPTPGKDWCSLLTLSSHDRFDWCWHDGDNLMVFIEKDKLAQRDFTNLKSDAG